MIARLVSLGRVLIAALCGVVSVAAVASADGGAAFSLQPTHPDPANPATQAYFVLDVAAGQTVHSAVLVRNNGASAGNVLLSLVNGTTDNVGGVIFMDQDTPRVGVAAWTTLAQTELGLAPGAQRAVDFSVTVPPGTGPGQYVGGISAENAATQPAATGGDIHINVRTLIQTAVQVNVPGPVTNNIAVTGVAAGGTAGDQTLLIGLKNDGNQMVRPVGTLTVTDARGTTVQQLAVKIGAFLPGTAIQYPAHVQKQALGDGQYQATLHLTYGVGGVTDAERGFSITPAQVARVFPTSVPLLPPPPAVARTAPSGLPLLTLVQDLALAVALAAGIGLAVTLRRR